jgi:hypothetical protein
MLSAYRLFVPTVLTVLPDLGSSRPCWLDCTHYYCPSSTTASRTTYPKIVFALFTSMFDFARLDSCQF